MELLIRVLLIFLFAVLWRIIVIIMVRRGKKITRNTPFAVLGYLLLTFIFVDSLYELREDIFSSVGSFCKYTLIYYVVIAGLRSIWKGFIRDKGNFGHEYDDTDLKDSG